MIVVDASALAAFILKEPGWRNLAHHLSDALSVDHVVKEVANAIWRAYAVKSIIGKSDALKLYRILASMIGVNIVLEPEEKYVGRALEIALEHRITVYDSLYLAQAVERSLPLLTLDDAQKRVARELGLELVVARAH